MNRDEPCNCLNAINVTLFLTLDPRIKKIKEKRKRKRKLNKKVRVQASHI